MTDNTTESSRRDVPAAADAVSSQPGNPMSENTVSRSEFEKVLRQAQRRKTELEQVTKERDEWRGKAETALKELDQASQEVESIREAYAKFTDENELNRELEELRADIKLRDLQDAFNGVDGVEYQDGVNLHDILTAAQLNPAEIDEITPEIVTKAIETARASKPFLFVSQPAQAEPQTPGDVRQEAASPPPSLKAFGAQASGGGSAPPVKDFDPVKEVDWRDPVAVSKFMESHRGGRPPY